MRTELLVIDPQVDFCDPAGALFVPEADKDMKRLAKMIIKCNDSIDYIRVTMDSHHFVDVAHPIMWSDSKGNHPAPFSIITEEDMENGTWMATKPPMQKRLKEYLHSLTKNGRYPLMIWPPHCLIGTPGHNVFPDMREALHKWEEQFAVVDYITKGSNIWTEHYSAAQADVPDPNDPDTQLNGPLLDSLASADLILLAGEARSHCLANTVRDIANNFGEENIKKFLLLTDATSDVANCEFMGESFMKEMIGRGMRTTTTKEFMA